MRWCREEDAGLALNVIWLVGEELVGTRLNRALDFTERDHAYECPICGHHHGPADADDYRAVVVASERITGENWHEVDDRVVWWIDEDFRLRSRPL